MIEYLKSVVKLGFDFVRRPIETWRNCEALAEFQDALEAEFASFCAARGLEPEAEGSWDAWWDALDAMLEAFASARGLDPEASSTLDAFETASDVFAKWCERSERQPFEAGLFEEWLRDSRDPAARP